MSNLDDLIPRHGGDPKSHEARFGMPKDGWLDVSTGINAVAYPVAPVPQHMCARLPQQDDMAALLAAARRAYRVPDHATIIASPGTQALIQMIPTLFEPSSVSILTPTYGEHAPAWTAAGHRVATHPSICAQAAAPSSFAVVVHPNNPDGRVQTVDGLVAMAGQQADRGGVLVVDEAFCDVTPALSVCPAAGGEGLVVLRSFGKFYGLAGVRLGFAITHADLGRRLADKLGPWAVSGPALWAGIHALRDDAWATTTRARLAGDAARLDRLLHGAGFVPVGGTDLFRLVARDDAPAVYENLARSGILVRPFADNSTWLRFGLPGQEPDWARLERALGAL